jgi:hypothetical protein
METKQTRHQVARGARPDAETYDKLLLMKRVSELRATYQIRLLTHRAVQERKRLVVEVPKGCKIHDTLRELITQYPQNIAIART